MLWSGVQLAVGQVRKIIYSRQQSHNEYAKHLKSVGGGVDARMNRGCTQSSFRLVISINNIPLDHRLTIGSSPLCPSQ